MNIKNFSEQLQALIQENENLKRSHELVSMQLCFYILDKTEDEDSLMDVSDIDFSQITFGLNRRNASIYKKINEELVRVNSWEDMPKIIKIEANNVFKV